MGPTPKKKIQKRNEADGERKKAFRGERNIFKKKNSLFVSFSDS